MIIQKMTETTLEWHKRRFPNREGEYRAIHYEAALSLLTNDHKGPACFGYIASFIQESDLQWDDFLSTTDNNEFSQDLTDEEMFVLNNIADEFLTALQNLGPIRSLPWPEKEERFDPFVLPYERSSKELNERS